MLSLRRFKWLADSYGADLQRWPQEERDDALALLGGSLEARELLAQARRLDEALEANARYDSPHRQVGRQAALDRLRSGVEARIAAAEPRSAGWGSGWKMEAIGRLLQPDFSWVGVATGGGLAIAAGLLIGGFYASAPPPASDALLSMLEPAPIHLLTE